jgi:excisionase family DNA binding protein
MTPALVLDSKAPTIPLKAAADRLGVHDNTVRNWIDRGVLHAYRLPTGARRLPVAEVERLEREMFAVPTSFPEEVVTPAPETQHPQEFVTRLP